MVVGMRIIGHNALDVYSQYNHTLKSQVKATQRSIGEGSDYASHVKDETERFKETTLKGKEDNLPPKLSNYLRQKGKEPAYEEKPTCEDILPSKKTRIEGINACQSISLVYSHALVYGCLFL